MGTNFYANIGGKSFHIGKHSLGQPFILAGLGMFRLAKYLYKFQKQEQSQEQLWETIFTTLSQLLTGVEIQPKIVRDVIEWLFLEVLALNGEIQDEFDENYTATSLFAIINGDNANFKPDIKNIEEIFVHPPFLVYGFDNFS